MIHATLIMSTPSSLRAPYATSHYGHSSSIHRRIARSIRRFAASRGVAACAVEYSIRWGR